jgi:hypothetical protein
VAAKLGAASRSIGEQAASRALSLPRGGRGYAQRSGPATRIWRGLDSPIASRRRLRYDRVPGNVGMGGARNAATGGSAVTHHSPA